MGDISIKSGTNIWFYPCNNAVFIKGMSDFVHTPSYFNKAEWMFGELYLSTIPQECVWTVSLLKLSILTCSLLGILVISPAKASELKLSACGCNCNNDKAPTLKLVKMEFCFFLGCFAWFGLVFGGWRFLGWFAFGVFFFVWFSLEVVYLLRIF